MADIPSGSKSLFVGGQRDGERIAVQRELNTVALPVYGVDVTEVAYYRRRKFRADERTIELFVAQGMSDFDAMQRLIDGYLTPR